MPTLRSANLDAQHCQILRAVPAIGAERTRAEAAGGMKTAERCNAVIGKGQCRCSKNLTRTRLSVFKNKYFKDRLPNDVIVVLCPKHLKITLIEALILSSPRTSENAT